MFRGHLVWGKMFTGRLVGGCLVKASQKTALGYNLGIFGFKISRGLARAFLSRLH